MAAQVFLENIQKAVGKKDQPYWIFFYLSKAYDVLDHKILLFKLDTYGIRGIVNQWFKTYLCNWKQYVEIKYMENTSQISEKFTSALKVNKRWNPSGLSSWPNFVFVIYK
jgi:hypothetical protein